MGGKKPRKKTQVPPPMERSRKRSKTNDEKEENDTLIDVLLSLSSDKPPSTQTPTIIHTTPVSGDDSSLGNNIAKNKTVDGIFGEEAEMGMDGEEALSFDRQNGKPKINFPQKVLAELRHQWKNSLIVKLFGKTINYDTLCSNARALWKLQGDFKAFDLGENYFSFTFEATEDRMHVYTEGPWVVMDHLLLVRKWEPNFKPSEARTIMRTAVWVRFRELPLEFLNDKILYILAKSLGMPIKVDHMTQGKFARVCVEIDLGKPLCPVIEVEGKDCEVEYESLQSFCFDCSYFGHIKAMKCEQSKATPVTNNVKSCSKAMAGDDMNQVKPKETEKNNDNLITRSTTMDSFETNVSSSAGNWANVETNLSYTKEVHMTDEVDHPSVLSGDRELPFTYIASLKAKLVAMTDNGSYVQGKIKGFLTGVKRLEYRKRVKFELRAYVDDGSLVSEILIDHNLVQKKIGHSPREVTSALSSFVKKKVSRMEEILRQFRDFLKHFEGTMLVQISEASPFPTVMEMNQGCSTSDARSLLRRLKSFNSNQTQQYPNVEPIDLSPTISEKTAPKTKKKINKEKQNEAEKGNDGISAMKNGGNINVVANGGSSPSLSPDLEIYDYLDPDFNDFDKERGVDCFEVGQIWALYESVTMGGMPRFYARVSKILSRSMFKLKITWLEPNPDDKNESKWVNAGLPVSCGNLRKGDTETTDDFSMFSHRVDWEKGSKRDTYKIYPQKGETWALFKDWDMNWHSNPERKYEFEFVEIMSDYHEDNGVSVAYLSKIKGFSCLFCRTPSGEDSFKISRNHLFRFSHRIPSFLLSGEERDDVPKDSFELDPAALPSNIEEIDIPKAPEVEVEAVVTSESDYPVCEVKDGTKSDSEGNSDFSEECPEACEISEPGFFNFDAEKSPEKFQPGQFWALYIDEDRLPKFYTFVRKVNHEPQFELLVTKLTACPLRASLEYADKLMPNGCGMFKHSIGVALSYTDTSRFSHRLNVKPTDKKGEFAIYPRKGEVWAVYKNWRTKMTRTNLKNYGYDIVEILEEKDFSVKGVVLEMVSGHNSVFKARSLVIVQINRTHLLKFSHQIPAFRLTGGSLRGCWKLDPSALPIEMFRSSLQRFK